VVGVRRLIVNETVTAIIILSNPNIEYLENNFLSLLDLLVTCRIMLLFLVLIKIRVKSSEYIVTKRDISLNGLQHCQKST
jgi:hypothetical protein